MRFWRWLDAALVLAMAVWTGFAWVAPGGVPGAGFAPVALATDVLVFLLLAAALGFARYARSRTHLAAPWRRVLQSKPGMAALVVLAPYLGIGLLDTIHYRPLLEVRDDRAIYAVDTSSVLDRVLQRLRTSTERTYSEPLATRAFQKEITVRPDGTQVREFPRLRHGGAHLADESDRLPDIRRRALSGIALGLLVWCALAALAIWGIARHRKTTWPAAARLAWRGDSDVPWKVIGATAGALLLIAFPVAMLAGPYHVLGTDKVGQDVLYLSLKSVRTALVIGTLTTLVTLPFGVLLGIMAGYFRGWIDDVIQYVYTTLNSIPAVLLIAAAVLMMQVYIDTHPELFSTTAERADLRLLFLCLILGITSWTGLCRLLRGEALKLRELEYIQAAHAFGVSDLRIIVRHILPNVMHIVLISLVMDFSGLVLAEAVLSYVGVGVDPAMISFGTMINAARLEMARDPMVWWSLLAAFVFMFFLVLAANLFADAVRDAFDPRASLQLSQRFLAARLAARAGHGS
ncbi:MAG TPA: ABC transporter permease [Burkholderiales bacterium]